MSPPLHPDLLMTHAGALRSMARALLGDEHAAEDVVQETWLRALSARPSADRGLGGWLRDVTGGFALQRRRSEGRREQRERAYASERREALDSEQRSAVLRTVMEAVLALDEPYRETVLLRWFEGLPPRAIAERLGVRVATIDSRLQRAHARLRAKLERELGDGERSWRAIVAVALGAPPRSAQVLATSAIPLIGVAVSLKLVGAALAAVVGVCLWLGWDRTRPPVVEPVGIAAADSAAQRTATLAATATSEGRAVVSDPATAEVPSVAPTSAEPSAKLERGPYAFTLRVEVVDSAERPIHGAEVFLGPQSCSTVRVGETGWDGVIEREWHGFEPAMRGVVYVRANGQDTSLRRVELTTGARYALRFQMDPRVTVLTFGVRLDRVRLAPTEKPAAPDAFALDSAGNGLFGDSTIARVVAHPATEMQPLLEQRGEVMNRILVDLDSLRADRLSASAEVVQLGKPLTSSGTAEAPPAATVRGVVRDERGQPLTDLVVAGRTPERWNTGVTCDADGAFVFTNVPPGPMEVCVGGGERVLVREVFELAPGETRFLELRPVPRPTLHVRLVDADDKALAKWIVEARGAGSPSMTLGAATTIDEGTAVVGLCAEGPYLLYARPESSNATAAVLVERGQTSEKGELLLRTPSEMSAASITFTVDSRTGEFAEARAWRADSGDGVMFGSTPLESADGRTLTTIQSRALLPGTWRIEWRTQGRPWTEMGRFEIAAGQASDLGPMVMAEPSRLALTSADPACTSAKLALRARVDGALVVWPERVVELPAMLETLPGVSIEILGRPADVEDAAATLPLRDPIRLGDGRELRIELRGPR